MMKEFTTKEQRLMNRKEEVREDIRMLTALKFNKCNCYYGVADRVVKEKRKELKKIDKKIVKERLDTIKHIQLVIS